MRFWSAYFCFFLGCSIVFNLPTLAGALCGLFIGSFLSIPFYGHWLAWVVTVAFTFLGGMCGSALGRKTRAGK